MTNKEFFNAIINANISEEITEKATALLASAEKKNTKRSESQNANRLANIELARSFANAMDEGRTYGASEIVALMGDEGLTTAKVTAVCKVGIEENIFEVVDDYKVGGKGRKVKGYKVKAEN